MANNQAKNVLIFSTAYLPLVGGAEIAVKEITDRVSGFQFDMITAKIKPGLPKFERIGNINVYRVRSPKLLLPFALFIKSLKLHKKNKYDITWAIMANRAGYAALFFKLVHSRIKYLLTLQEGDALDYPKKRAGIIWLFVGFLFKQIFRKADHIQAISNFLSNWAKEMGAKKEKVKIVPNGVDTRKFKRADDQTINKLKQELGIKDEKVILHVGRLVKKNGLEDLIEAGRYLDFPFKIVLVGGGKDEYKLENLAKKLALRDKVIFVGHIDYKDLSKYYSVADVFVRPSLSEGQGISFLEAMAMNVPIIGTPVGGIVDFLTDRETGLFCQVNNPQSIAEKIKEILSDQSLREKIVINAKNLVEEKYSWDKIAIQMEDVFNKLL